jgi:hypothetical protein
MASKFQVMRIRVLSACERVIPRAKAHFIWKASFRTA